MSFIFYFSKVNSKGVSTTKIKEELGLQKAVNGVNQIPVPKNEQ